jgi:hypothetical protein
VHPNVVCGNSWHKQAAVCPPSTQRVILIDSIKHCIKHANRSSGPYAPTIQTMQRTNAMTVRLDHYQSWPIIALQPTMAQAPHRTDTPAHHTSNTLEQTRLSSGTCQRRPWCNSPPLVTNLPPLQPFPQQTPLPITALPPRDFACQVYPVSHTSDLCGGSVHNIQTRLRPPALHHTNFPVPKSLDGGGAADPLVWVGWGWYWIINCWSAPNDRYHKSHPAQCTLLCMHVHISHCIPSWKGFCCIVNCFLCMQCQGAMPCHKFHWWSLLLPHSEP